VAGLGSFLAGHIAFIFAFGSEQPVKVGHYALRCVARPPDPALSKLTRIARCRLCSLRWLCRSTCLRPPCSSSSSPTFLAPSSSRCSHVRNHPAN
jgi:hypothetical protein